MKVYLDKETGEKYVSCSDVVTYLQGLRATNKGTKGRTHFEDGQLSAIEHIRDKMVEVWSNKDAKVLPFPNKKPTGAPPPEAS